MTEIYERKPQKIRFVFILDITEATHKENIENIENILG